MSIRERLNAAATKAVFEAEWDTVTWEDAKKGYRENDAWDRFKEDHAFYYQAGEDAVTLILDVLIEHRGDWIDEAYPASHPALHGMRAAVASNLVAVLRGDE